MISELKLATDVKNNGAREVEALLPELNAYGLRLIDPHRFSSTVNHDYNTTSTDLNKHCIITGEHGHVLAVPLPRQDACQEQKTQPNKGDGRLCPMRVRHATYS